jgi:hypothetical protein
VGLDNLPGDIALVVKARLLAGRIDTRYVAADLDLEGLAAESGATFVFLTLSRICIRPEREIWLFIGSRYAYLPAHLSNRHSPIYLAQGFAICSPATLDLLTSPPFGSSAKPPASLASILPKISHFK